MKNFLVLLVMIISGLPVFANNTYAVIVGVSQYNDRAINGLRFAHKDAELYKSFLQSPKGGSIPEQNIVLLTNEKATRSTIMKSVRNLFSNATEEDVVIFYYSGHGVPDAKNTSDLYFATYDTEENNYVGTALYIDDVIRIFTHSHAKLKLFLADACHSGGSGIRLGIKDDGAELVNKLLISEASMKEPGWAAITASSSSEKSFEDQKWGGGHGIFTYALVNGLQGEADKTDKQNKKSNGNGDGIVTVRELYDYLNAIIPGETDKNQHPDLQGKNENIFPLSAVSIEKFNNAVKKYNVLTPTDLGNSAPGLISKEEKPKFDLTTQLMDLKSCTGAGYGKGEYEFFNDYGEDILYTSVYGRGVSIHPLNILIAPGESAKSTKVNVGIYSNMTFQETENEVKFYFHTVDETKPIKYGTLTLNVEVCKTKKLVLSRKNLYLSVNGEKY